MPLDKPYLDIPGTTVFDAEQARKGYWLNQFCMSLMHPENRARFKAETGYTLHEYLIHRRVEEAHRRLSSTDEDITNIAHNLGFSSSQYFATVFRRETGMTPGEYRDSHRKS